MRVITPEELADQLLNAHRGGIEASLKRMAKALALKAQQGAVNRLSQRNKTPSGHLKRSIAGKVKSRFDGFDVVLRAGGRHGGTDVRYARIQDQGGTIVPRSAQWLTIPVHKSLFTPGGASRYASPRLLAVPLRFQLGKSAGTALLISKENGEIYYVLKKSVTLKGTRYLSDTVTEIQGMVPAAAQDAMVNALVGTLSGRR
tara:strand:- start:1120 stop:1722 length:603 start_codon:yes stop_codon:yes gene_type:complete